MEKRRKLSVRIPVEQFEAIDKIAYDERDTITNIISDAVALYLKHRKKKEKKEKKHAKKS
jgi:metal-responsive CopG/Arc/MetJ family transcriptional regulator